MIHNEYRLINKILLTGDFQTVEKLKIEKNFFKIAECGDAFEFIKNYTKSVNTYGYMPSQDLFKKHFPGFLFLDEVKDALPVLCEDLRVFMMQQQIDNMIDEAQASRLNPYKALEILYGGTSTMLSQHTANTRLFKIEECGELLLEDFNRMQQNNGVMGIPWPFPSLNEQTMGLKKGDWIVEYGRPKAGKTSIVIAALQRIYEKGRIRVGVFNFEDSEWDILRLFQAYRARVDYFSLKRNELSDIEKVRYTEACRSLVKEADEGKLFFVENCPGADLNHIKGRIDEFNLDVVVINGVYFLKDVGTKKIDMDWKAVTNISRNAKQIAKEKQVAIIGITQANRQTEQVAYADAFTQDCDAMIKIEPVKRSNETREMWTKCSLEHVRGGGMPIDFCIYTKLGISIQEVAFPEDEIEIKKPEIKKQENPFSFAAPKKRGLLG